MKQIAVSEIHIALNRQRKAFDPGELNELADSIQKQGLLHPIILRVADEEYVLVAGERRLRAVKDIYDLSGAFKHDGEAVRSGFIPYTLLGDLSPLEIEEAELDENIKRTDLTWQERAAATARLTSLRQRQDAATGSDVSSIADIAKEVRGSSAGSAYDDTRKEMIVARHLDDPEVRAATNVREAYKVLQRKEITQRHRELGAEVGRTFSADMHRLIHGDSCEWLRNCPADSFDVILTDPPYGMGADEFGNSGKGVGGGGQHAYDDSRENWERLMAVFAPQSFRVAKPEAHLYVFCDFDNLFDLRLWLSEAGWQMFRTPLIWHKPAAFRAPWPEHGPQRKYETLLYGVKGKRRTLKLAPDVITCPPDANEGHNAQKPIALFEDLLRRSVHPGDTVLDPFCGSGPVFPAAHSLQCRATGIELDQGAYGIAVSRIEKLKAQLELGL